MSVTAAPDLHELQRQARSYPGYLLPRGGSAVALFSAGYWGWNDCIHFFRHNMTCDCVDVDAEKLEAMRHLYPETWSFTVDDAWVFAERALAAGTKWDVLSADSFLGDATERSIAYLDVWCELATRLVTITVPLRCDAEPPAGWTSFLFPRSPKASWLVLERSDN